MTSKRFKMRGRHYIGINFKCCNVYARVYLNNRGEAYVGHCPKCSSKVVVKAGPKGKRSRFWFAG